MLKYLKQKQRTLRNKKWVHFCDNGTFLFAREKKDVIEREIALCGYFCIVTSKKMTAKGFIYVLYPMPQSRGVTI